jgi:hypothetical protein
MLWNVPSYERLVTAWGLDAKHATKGKEPMRGRAHEEQHSAALRHRLAINSTSRLTYRATCGAGGS